MILYILHCASFTAYCMSPYIVAKALFYKLLTK